MALSEARLRATQKYHNKFERIRIRVTPEEKEAIEAYAEEINESVNAFVRRAIAETMDREKKAKEQDMLKNSG